MDDKKKKDSTLTILKGKSQKVNLRNGVLKILYEGMNNSHSFSIWGLLLSHQGEEIMGSDCSYSVQDKKIDILGHCFLVDSVSTERITLNPV
jgi:hypothetical protein